MYVAFVVYVSLVRLWSVCCVFVVCAFNASMLRVFVSGVECVCVCLLGVCVVCVLCVSVVCVCRVKAVCGV